MKAANSTDALMKEAIVTRMIKMSMESNKFKLGTRRVTLVVAFRRVLVNFVWAEEALGPSPAPSHVKIGLSTKATRPSTTRSKPKLDTIGLAMAHPPVSPLPSVVTILTMTRPTMSSIMAAPTRMTPTRLFCKLAEERIANVVPRDVEHSDAPAENAANGLGYNVPALLENGSASRVKDKAIGNDKPTVAMDIDTYALSRNRARSVLRPPSKTRLMRPT